ncbi:hypothetical protein A1QO_02790 [Vibrio genomosp. F10 str. ZF-129]|uniref:Uncharacterized protein n=1 Tax=Vibrio genomosp. F10 str. ZF-129 TaxID=1187848 RepID=A0A1E5BKC0_9VIBR|nr:hypothetical protein [Vibrio genomosp. F10]OEE38323.1 hypothetical protein A1QO_02790 [Vibrio genomosp. F10 str. ZF-129]
MKTFTAEELISAIRSADSLAELKRMVGTTNDLVKQSSDRIAEIDRINDQHGYDIDTMPWQVSERYKTLQAEQDAFESVYC